MNKLTKQMLTGVIALGLLAPVATSALNPINNISINAKRHHRRAKHHTYSPMPKFLYGHWHNHYGGRLSFNESSANIWPNHHHGHFYDAASWSASSYGNTYYIKLLMDYRHNLSYGPKRTWKIHRYNNRKIYVYKQDGKHTSTGVYYK